MEEINETLSSQTKTDETVIALRNLIIARKLKTGDLLPSEAELCAELGIGRNSLREAVRTLKATGVLDVRHGSGTYVGEMSMQALSQELLFHGLVEPSDKNQYLKNLSEVRETLEVGLISKIISEGLGSNIDELSAILMKMDEEAKTGAISARTDRLFHETLLKPIQNNVATLLLQSFWDVFEELLEPIDNVSSAHKIADRHHQILLAVKSGDVRGARIAMGSHFDGLRTRLGMETFNPNL